MPTRIRPHNRRKICWDIVLNREDFKERKNSTPLPCPLHSKLGCLLFSWGSSHTSAQHCMKGMGEKKLHFPVLKSEKRQKSPLGRSYVATTNQRWREIEACFSNSIIHITLKAFQFIALSSRSSGIELGGGLEPTTGKTSPFARGLSVVLGLEHILRATMTKELSNVLLLDCMNANVKTTLIHNGRNIK